MYEQTSGAGTRIVLLNDTLSHGSLILKSEECTSMTVVRGAVTVIYSYYVENHEQCLTGVDQLTTYNPLDQVPALVVVHSREEERV